MTDQIPVPMERMGRCAKLAWEHAVEEWRSTPEERRRPGVMTGHMLLGVLQEPTCAGGLILRKMGLDLQLAIDHAQFALVYGRRRDGVEEPTVDWGGVPHTPAAYNVIKLCEEEADLFSATYPIGTEHLTLALLRTEAGMGNLILRHFGISQNQARVARDTWWDVLKLSE